jgi:hypothetical protein
MGSLLLETQNSYNEYIEKVADGCQYIADKIREGNLPKAMTAIIDFSDGMSWILEVERHMLENEYVIESKSTVAYEHLKEINESLERQDYVFVADLFEYEIKPLFESANKWEFLKIGTE